jgi:hypothetical protein
MGSIIRSFVYELIDTGQFADSEVMRPSSDTLKILKENYLKKLEGADIEDVSQSCKLD